VSERGVGKRERERRKRRERERVKMPEDSRRADCCYFGHWTKLGERMTRWRVGPPVGISWLAGRGSLAHLLPPTIDHRCCRWLSAIKCLIRWPKKFRRRG
jgi:hypothetical protein